MQKVLFVCLGNICRSTMAEGILSHKIKERNLQQHLSCYSVGTASYHLGGPPDRRTMKVLIENGIKYEHSAAQIEPSHLKEVDFVFAMDQSNLRNVQQMERENGLESKAVLFRESYGSGEETEVPDPYYGGENGFYEVYEMLAACCDRFLEDFA